MPTAHSNNDPFVAFDSDEAGESDASTLSELQKLVLQKADIDDINWEEDFLVQVSPTSAKSHCEGGIQGRYVSELEGNEDLEEETDLVTEPRLKSLPEALASPKDTFEYLDYRGFTYEATQVMSAMSTVAALCHAKSSKKSTQTTLYDFMYSH